MGYSIAVITTIVLLAWKMKRTLDVNILRLALKPLAASLAMACVLITLRVEDSLRELLLAIPTGAIAYAVVLWLIDRRRLTGEYRTVRDLLFRTPGAGIGSSDGV